MRRPLTVLAALFLTFFALITVRRLLREGRGDVSSSARDAARIRSFWQVYNDATRLRTEGRYDDAARLYRDALALDPRHEDSLFYLSVSLEQTGHHLDATEVLRELTSSNPESGRGWSQLGSLLASRAPGTSFDPEGARAAFDRAEQINQEHSGPFLAKGTLALDLGKRDEAARWFRLASDMSSPEGSFQAGVVDFLDGKWSEAARYFARVLDAAAREGEISGRGATSEGDVDLPAHLTPLESARLRSRVFLYWVSRRLGSYPDAVRETDRLDWKGSSRFGRTVETEGRAVVLDLDHLGGLDVVVCTPGGVRTTDGRWSAVAKGAAWDGVAFDADGDGWQDLYVLGGSGYSGTGSNRLYRNEGGRLVDATERFGLKGERLTARALASDFDGDGKIDLLEVGSARPGLSPVRLFLGSGAGFVESAKRLGLDYPTHLVDAAVGDVDGDDRPDVFLLGWKAAGRLYRNTGTGFEDATEPLGLAGVGGEGLSALFFDFDRDADPDLLVTAHAPLALSLRRLLAPAARENEATPRLFRNEGGRRFVEITHEVGLDRQYGVVQAVASDVNGDGFLDLLFAMGGLEASHLEPSVVLRNEAGKSLVETAYIPSRDQPRRALGILAADLDGDGSPQIFLATQGGTRP